MGKTRTDKTKANGNDGKINGALALAIALALATLTLFFMPASAQTTLKACQGNSICEIELVAGRPEYRNCQGCGTDIIYCNNRPTSVERLCRSSAGFTAQCVSGPQVCPIAGKSDPSAILKFRVYIPRGIEITSAPETRANIAGRVSEFKVTAQNKNPVILDTLLSAEVAAENKEDWQLELPKTAQLGANGRQEFSLRVTAPAATPDGDYPILITAFGLQTDNSNVVFEGKKSVLYQVASRAAPSISVEPTTQTGVAGQEQEYNVTVTNNDPRDFDASGIALSAKLPQKWQANFASRTLRLKPGENGTTKMEITPDTAAKQGQYDIEVNASVNALTTSASAQFVVSTCGDSVCGVGEQCAIDCPLETNFACSGRCERQTDTGLDFSAQVKFAFSNFAICSRTSTPEQCRAAFNSNSCGIGKSCLCGNRFDAACPTRCVDSTGAYYLFATQLGSTGGQRSSANYSFECPFVNLDEIKGLRAEFNSAKQDFEKSRSGIKESLNKASREERQTLQPCYDGLGQIIQMLGEHVAYMDEVIKFPAVSNTTEARAKSADLRKGVDSAYDLFCKGAAGALQIVSMDARESVEKGKNALAAVTVRNGGNINYYGYVSCDFTSPQGRKNTTNTTCAPMSFGRDQTFSLEAKTDAEGAWDLQCRSFGSLNQDCSRPELHDQTEAATFRVFSRDTFVKDVSGTCTEQGAGCTVRLNNEFACAGCRIEDRDCARQSQDGDTTVFICPRAVPGKYSMTGYVIPTSQCNPVAPKEKSAQVQCLGCGDGTVQKDKGEQCELPNTDNNQQCGQTEFIIESGRRGFRDKYGFCTPQCQCSPDEFSFTCVKGVGGATCGDGETRVVTKTVDGKQATCTEQCGPACTFLECNAEPARACTDDSQCGAGKRCVNNACVAEAALAVTVTHAPERPSSSEQVTITANSNGQRTDIYADGSAVKSCTTSPCSYAQSYSAGRHSYFAVTYRGGESKSDPISGTKAFEAIQAAGAGTGLSVAHSPAAPTTAQDVTITATGSAESLTLFVDAQIAARCDAPPCTYTAKFTEGTHTYFVSALRGGQATTDPQSGTKTFTVRSASIQCSSNATCTSVPAPACIGPAFRTYRLPSTCAAGACTYQFTDESCQRGCTASGCVPDSGTIITPTENISISITHAPSNPGIDDNATFTATANKTVDRIDIFVDNFLKRSCNATAICTYAQKLTVGNHDYYGIFSKNNTTGRTPTKQVFASSQSLASIRSIDVPENVILGANAALDFELQNPDAARFGRLTCTVTTPTQARTATQCFQLPQQQSRQSLLLSANQLGVWNVTACEFNVSARSDCANSQQSDVETNLGTFFVVQPTDIFISNVRSPQSAVVNSNASINVTLQNPTDRSRFVRASCLLRTPNAQDITLQSQCLGLSLNSTRTMELQFQPGILGTWTLASCASDASQSTDCSNAARTQTLALSRPINAVKSDNLDITSASISSGNITIGEPVSVSVAIRNPTDIDRFAQTTCIFRTQNQANLPNSSSCSPIKKDETQNAIVTVKPPFVGRWNVTQCAVSSSLNVDCAQSKQDDLLDNIGIFEASNPQPPGGGGGGGGNGTGNGTGTAEKCEVLRFKAECVFSRTTNRYTVSAEMTWNGGDHAHAIIGDDTGPLKYTDKTFAASRVIATPGKIAVKPVVHDADDDVLCSKPEQEVLCLAGNATSTPEVQIFRRMPEVASPGPVQVELVMQPLENAANFTITEHAEQSLPITNVIITGNQTLVRRNSTTAASLESNRTLTAWSFNTALKKGQNITIAYTVSPLEERDYKFFYVANISGDIVQEKQFNLFITTCPQKTPVWASGPGGACIRYRVACMVPQGWTIVEKCPETPPPGGGGEGGDSTAFIVAVVIVIIILVLGYKKREQIREWIRERTNKQEEEMPGFRGEEGR